MVPYVTPTSSEISKPCNESFSTTAGGDSLWKPLIIITVLDAFGSYTADTTSDGKLSPPLFKAVILKRYTIPGLSFMRQALPLTTFPLSNPALPADVYTTNDCGAAVGSSLSCVAFHFINISPGAVNVIHGAVGANGATVYGLLFCLDIKRSMVLYMLLAIVKRNDGSCANSMSGKFWCERVSIIADGISGQRVSE